jgi:hypothetical protein
MNNLKDNSTMVIPFIVLSPYIAISDTVVKGCGL